ncbi:MAG: hypothetical protein ABW069_01210 [Duganella sp.]
MTNQIDSPDGIPRKDGDRPSPDTTRTVGNGAPGQKAADVRPNSPDAGKRDADPQQPSGEYPANDQPLPGKR